MLNITKIVFICFSLSLTITWHSYSQNNSPSNDFLSQNFILSIEGGINYGFTDYKTSNIEPGFRGSIEYFPVIINNARFGLKLFGGGTSLSFSDSRGSISNNDQPNPRNIPVDIKSDIIQMGGSVSFGLAFNESLISYLNVGAAYLIFNPKNSDGTKLEFNALEKYDKKVVSFVLEGGLRYKLSNRFGLNFAMSYYPTSTDYLDDISAAKGNDSFLSGLIGLSFALSGSPDSDDDGISDNIDQCPDTPKGIKVDEFGCPIDSDSDGVPDSLDKCPDTPAEVKVDSSGCPLDIDMDGVPDYLDKCPGTPINTKVDSTGCPEGTNETFYQFILRGDDTFETNTAVLKEAAKILLNEIAGYMKDQPGSKWRIEGYTDNQGSAYLLKKLSYDRAKTISEYLISQGLSGDRISVFGLGNSAPIASNDSPEGRSTNRRIIIMRED